MNFGHVTLYEGARSQVNTLILGSIGFGKSKFVEYLLRQDLAGGRPFCLIDFHGPLYANTKLWCAYKNYTDRNLILLDPSRGNFVKGFNPFEKKEGLEASAQSSGMVEAILSVWGDSNTNSYPVMFKLLKLTFTAMIQHSIPLPQAFTLLSDRVAFSAVVEKLSDPLIKSLWADLSKLSQSEWTRQASPAINRLFRVVQNKAVRRFMGSTDPEFNLKLNFRDTILVNLGASENLDADAAKTFAALLLNELYHSAKRRKITPGKSLSPYYVYVDEWWQLPSPDFQRILAETRKFGLLLVLANQDLAQIKASFGAGFKESLLTLCQTQCCFGGLNHSDAARLAKEWGVPEEMVRTLTKRQCLVKLPRVPPTLISVPEVKDPYVQPHILASFEEAIARRSGALPVAQVDELLAQPKPQTPVKELTYRDFIR